MNRALELVAAGHNRPLGRRSQGRRRASAHFLKTRQEAVSTVRFVDRLDGYQRNHPRAGFPLAVLCKYFDDQGRYPAALIAYYGFVSLFPLLLLLSTVLGVVLAGDPHAQT